MSVVTNPIFWIIIGAIVFVMALIGYLAEGTELVNNNSKKKSKEKKEASEKDSGSVSPNVPLNEVVNNNEVEASSDWTGEVQKEDEKKINYNETSNDDWMVMPTGIDSADANNGVLDNITEDNKSINDENLNEDTMSVQSSMNDLLLPNEEILKPVEDGNDKQDDSMWK